jgi:hypothetical protein
MLSMALYSLLCSSLHLAPLFPNSLYSFTLSFSLSISHCLWIYYSYNTNAHTRKCTTPILLTDMEIQKVYQLSISIIKFKQF